MTYKEFVIWLQGFLDGLEDSGSIEPWVMDKINEQIKLIQEPQYCKPNFELVDGKGRTSSDPNFMLEECEQSYLPTSHGTMGL